MTYRTRHTTFLQHLTIIAKRAHKWALAIQPRAQQHGAIIRHIGRAY